MQFESKTRLAQARRHTRIDPRSGIRTLGPVAHCRMGWQGTRTADRCCRTTPVGRVWSRHRQMNFRSSCSTQAFLVVTSQHRNRRFALHCGPLKKDFNRCTNSTCGKRLCRITAASVSRGGKAAEAARTSQGASPIVISHQALALGRSSDWSQRMAWARVSPARPLACREHPRL